jgi:hypothetical protein
VAWRGGVDLNPLDVRGPDAAAWLEVLVWPEQRDRRERLRRAVEVARREPPELLRGDLFDALPVLRRQVPADTALVVFHSAVIAYLEPPDRSRFQQLMTSLVADGSCHWVSNEAAAVLPDVTATGLGRPPDPASFVLGVDGRTVAWTHQHGASLTWLPERDDSPTPQED